MKREIWETNRELKRRPVKVRVWCYGCDRNLVHPDLRCSVCGSKSGIKRNKK